MSFPIPVRPGSHAIYKEIYTMNNVKKMAVTLAMFGMGVFGLANNINTPVNNVNQVQAAAKPKKSKVHHYKKAHAVMAWGPVMYSNDVTKITSADGIDNNVINGYKYVNGQKWYHIEEYGGAWINGISLKKPNLYTAKSNVTIYGVVANSDGTGEVCYEPKTVVKKGTTVGKFNYLKPVNITSYQDPDTNDNIKFAGKKVVQEHSPWIPDVNDLSKGEVEGTYTVEAGKYLEILLPNGDYGFIKARDISKFKKGGSNKAFKKLQDVSALLRGTNVVKGGIKDAQWF